MQVKLNKAMSHAPSTFQVGKLHPTLAKQGKIPKDHRELGHLVKVKYRGRELTLYLKLIGYAWSVL